jgi:hypothetical protein
MTHEPHTPLQPDNEAQPPQKQGKSPGCLSIILWMLASGFMPICPPLGILFAILGFISLCSDD